MEHEGHICFFPFYMRSVLSVKNSLDHACSTFCKKRKFCIAFDFFLALNNIMTTWLYASTLHSINAFGTVYTTNSLSPSENSFDKIVDLLFLTKCSIWKKKKERIWKFITLSRAWKSFYPDSRGKWQKALCLLKQMEKMLMTLLQIKLITLSPCTLTRTRARYIYVDFLWAFFVGHFLFTYYWPGISII